MRLEDILKRIENESAMMLYFSGESCQVCHALRPKIKDLFHEKFSKIPQIYLDAKEEIAIASHFGVFSIPTLLVFLEGREFIREGRAMSLYQLEEKLERPYEMMLG